MKSAQSGVFSSSVEGSRRSQVPHEAQSMFCPWIGGRHSFGCHLPRSHLIITPPSMFAEDGFRRTPSPLRVKLAEPTYATTVFGPARTIHLAWRSRFSAAI